MNRESLQFGRKIWWGQNARQKSRGGGRSRRNHRGADVEGGGSDDPRWEKWGTLVCGKDAVGVVETEGKNVRKKKIKDWLTTSKEGKHWFLEDL